VARAGAGRALWLVGGAVAIAIRTALGWDAGAVSQANNTPPLPERLSSASRSPAV
jgi:hypothetical protein